MPRGEGVQEEGQEQTVHSHGGRKPSSSSMEGTRHSNARVNEGRRFLGTVEKVVWVGATSSRVTTQSIRGKGLGLSSVVGEGPKEFEG